MLKIKYHKINSIFKRDVEGYFLDEYSRSEFEYLKNNKWVGTEKIDGTNIRIHWKVESGTFIGGRNNISQIPSYLYDELLSLVKNINFKKYFNKEVMLFGEGYGNKIQKVGKQYNPDGVSFILFDVMIDGLFLQRHSVDEIAEGLGIKSVPVVFKGTLDEGIEFTKKGFRSSIGNAPAEGLVLVPEIPMLDRRGKRIITKLKTSDYLKEVKKSV